MKNRISNHPVYSFIILAWVFSGLVVLLIRIFPSLPTWLFGIIASFAPVFAIIIIFSTRRERIEIWPFFKYLFISIVTLFAILLPAWLILGSSDVVTLGIYLLIYLSTFFLGFLLLLDVMHVKISGRDLNPTNRIDMASLIESILDNHPEVPAETKKTQLEALKTFSEYRNGQDSWVKFGILVPLIIACITVITNQFIQYQTITAQAQLEKDQGAQQFEMQALNMIVSSSTPQEAINKAKMLSKIFKEKLPELQNEQLNPGDFTVDSAASKITLITLIAEHPDQKNEIMELWHKYFQDTSSDPNQSAGNNGSSAGTKVGFPGNWGQEVIKILKDPTYVSKLLTEPGFKYFLLAVLSDPNVDRFIKDPNSFQNFKNCRTNLLLGMTCP